MAKKIEIPELVIEIEKQLKEYSLDVADALKKEIKDEAKRAVRRLKQISPKGESKKKKYAKGWRYKVNYEDMNDIRITIYNANKPSLTHLLENGHLVVQGKRKGDRVEGRPHIRIVEKEIEENLDASVKVITRR